MAEVDPQSAAAAAFDNRYSVSGRSLAESHFMKAMAGLYQAAKSVPDRQAPEDRAEIVASMTRGSGKAPDPAPPNHGAMSEKEFAAELARQGL